MGQEKFLSAFGYRPIAPLGQSSSKRYVLRIRDLYLQDNYIIISL